MQDDELLTQQAACAFFGGDRPLHYSTLYRGIVAGRFPKPVRIGPNTSRWLRSECQSARDALIAARDGTTGGAGADHGGGGDAAR